MEIKKIDSLETNLVVDLFDKYRVFYKQRSDVELSGNYIRTRLDNKESMIFVALIKKGEKNVPVGFTQLYPKFSSVRITQNWILNDLFVKRDYRR